MLLRYNNSRKRFLLLRASRGSIMFEFFKLGMEHIITGYDHLLFLFALLLARQSFKSYLAIITSFTIAHSITLTLGALGYINLPSLLVESVIALSICYVAIENIVRKEVKTRWVLTFIFGLIHGLGFAGLIGGMNLPTSNFILTLLSFNLGIEVVQIALVAIIVPILNKMQHTSIYPKTQLTASAIITLIGGYWVVERLFM